MFYGILDNKFNLKIKTMYTENEILQVVDIIDKYKELDIKADIIETNIQKLENEKNKLLNELGETVKTEEALLAELTKKYGSTLNINTVLEKYEKIKTKSK